MIDEPSDEKKKERKISMGPAILQAEEEAGHYGLYRPLFIDAWDDKRGMFVRISTDSPIGPIAVFREARSGEKVDMKTIHPVTQKKLDLTCVWDPSHTFLRGRDE